MTMMQRTNNDGERRIALLWLALVLLGAPCAFGGAAELALDRAAVTDLLAATLPGPIRVEAPGLGELLVHLDPPGEVRFVEGGIEAQVPLRVPALGWTGMLDARYVPEVEPLQGTVRLRAESIVPRSALPFSPEFAGWVESVELPRRFDWELELDDRLPLGLTCFVQGLKVTDRRLELRLFLVTRVSDGGSSRTPQANAAAR